MNKLVNNQRISNILRLSEKCLQRGIGINNTLNYKGYKLFRTHPEYKGLLKRNSQLKDIHKGERCFILGNGPSIKEIDFSRLANEVTFTVNQLPRNPQFKEIRTNYHSWVDEIFFDLDRDKTEDMELLQVMKDVNIAGNKPIVFYKIEALPMIKKYKLDKKLNVFYLGSTRLLNGVTPIKKQLDICNLIPNFCTVIHYLICVAVYMGFKEIYLLGCDCTGILSAVQSRMDHAENSQYGYKISDNEKKRMERMYKQYTLKTEVMVYLGAICDYEVLDQYCKNNGVKLFNATKGSLLDTVEKVKLEDIL